MANGDYARAYHMESASLQAQYPSFVANRSEAQPLIRIVSVGTPSSDAGTADVSIKFYAQDQNPSPQSDTTCRYFDMTAKMVENSNGSWSYDGPTSPTSASTPAGCSA